MYMRSYGESDQHAHDVQSVFVLCRFTQFQIIGQFVHVCSEILHVLLVSHWYGIKKFNTTQDFGRFQTCSECTPATGFKFMFLKPSRPQC